MWRPLLDRYYPHAILLTSAAACLLLTPPTNEPVTAYVQRADDSADQVVELLAYEPTPASYDDDLQTQRNLRKLMHDARMKYVRAELTRKDEPEQKESASEAPSIKLPDAPRHKIVNSNESAILTAPAQTLTPEPEYVTEPDPLAWKAPEALASTEYTVLGYGEVGEVEPVRRESSQLLNSQATQTLNQAQAGGLGFVMPTAQSTPTTEGPIKNVSLSEIVTSKPTETADVISPLATPQAADFALQGTASRAVRSVAQTAESEPEASRALSSIMSQQDQAQTQSTSQNKTPIITKTTQTLGTDKIDAGESSDRFPNTHLVSNPNASKSTETSQPDTPNTQQTVLAVKQQKSQDIATVPGITTSDKPDLQDIPSAAQPNASAATTKPTSNVDTGKKQSQSLVVLIDESNPIGSDRLNAIGSAVQQINQVAKQAQIDIELSVTTDKNVDHNILVREDNNKALNGKLGLAESAALVDDHGNEQRLGQDASELGGKAIASINSDINWYTGEDSSAIGKNQYDYQTAITHELLHLLGLDDDFGDSVEQVMHGYLSQGESRRVIAAAEQAELASRYASANLWRSVSNAVNKYTSKSRKNIRYKSEALTAAPVPEPASLMLIGSGISIIWLRRRC